MDAGLLPRLPEPHRERGDGRADRQKNEDELGAEEGRQPDDHPRDQRQLGVEGRVKVRERRHHLQHDDRDEDERQRHEDRRIDQRRHHLPLHGRDDLRCTRRSGAASRPGCRCARRQGARPYRRSETARRGSQNASDSAVPDRTCSYTSSSTLRKTGELTRRLQEIQRLDERHAGLEQRRQLLIENEKLGRRDRRPARQPHGYPGDRSLRLEREDVKPLLFELVAQPGFCLGDVHALDDFAAGRCQAAAELHCLRRSQILAARACRRGHYGP